MRKQYRITDFSTFKKHIQVYHDGNLVFDKPMWLDDAQDAEDQLEAKGYTIGYTCEEIRQEWEKYTNMKANRIERR